MKAIANFIFLFLSIIVFIFPTATSASSVGWQPMSTENGPGDRTDFTAIWTGSRMIVWGGYSGANPTNSGYSYNPSSDTWTVISTTNAPSPRSQQFSIWTGSKMIIWGGRDANWNGLNDGVLYDPTQNSWTPISDSPVEDVDVTGTAVWTGSKMIIWGGFGVGEDASGVIYDPAQNTWAEMSNDNAPEPRVNPAAVWTGSKLIIWGGQSNDGIVDTGGIYDLESNSWSPIATEGAPPAQTADNAVWTGSKMIFWGNYLDYNPETETTIHRGYSYSPATDSWAEISNTNSPSSGRGSSTPGIWTGSEYLIWGGFDGNAEVNFPIDGGAYNPVTDTWTPLSTENAPEGRGFYSAVWTGSKMIIWGGWNFDSSPNSGGVYSFGGTSGPTFENLPGKTEQINLAEGQLITANSYLLTVKPEAENGIEKVEFYVDDNLICTATTPDNNGVYSCVWDTTRYHSDIRIVAYDNSGNTVTLTRTTVVQLPETAILPETGKSSPNIPPAVLAIFILFFITVRKFANN